MPQRKKANPEHREGSFVSVVGKLERARHDAKPESADRAREHETVLHDPAAERYLPDLLESCDDALRPGMS